MTSQPIKGFAIIAIACGGLLGCAAMPAPGGSDGAPGAAGEDGSSCTVAQCAASGITTLSCTDGTSVQIACAPAPKTYAIGDTGPAGGLVFYVTPDGLHGQEAAPVDHSEVRWGCRNTEIPGADGLLVGTGPKNTRDIVTWCMEAGIAARIANNYTLNGHSDWFLPSKEALDLMYNNIGPGAAPPNTNVGGFANDDYWSSSEFRFDGAWGHYFYKNESATKGSKNGAKRVRAVRAF